MKKAHSRRMPDCMTRKRSFYAFGAAALLAVAATAQVATIDSRTYAEQLEACRSGASHQARDSCMREVHAAQAARERGQLGQQDAYMANALARCNAYRVEEDANACRARVMGQGTISGSVTSGGLLRQYEYTVPGEPAAPGLVPGASRPSEPMGAGPASGLGGVVVVRPLPPAEVAPPAPRLAEPSRLSPDHPAASMARPAEPAAPVRLQPDLPAFPMYQK